MRSAVGIFGLICGALVVWTVAGYGYASTDDPAAKLNIAFLFGVIAAGGLFGHAVAVNVWRINRFWSVMIGLACAAALVINLSNSLGALAGRNSRATAEATSKTAAIADDRRELARLEKALADLGKFTPTDSAAVAAAKRTADAATGARKAECGNGDPKQRGRFCRQKEDEEGKANTTLTTATADKATTDRAKALEADMRPIRERLRTAGPVQPANVQGSAIAKLFRLPAAEAEFAATVQQIALAAVVEALIVLSMVAFELMGKAPAAAAKGHSSPPEPPREPERAPVIPEPPKPKLVASNPAPPVGSVKRILSDHLEAAHGSRVEIAELGGCYRAVCRAEGKRPVSLEEFVAAVEAFCKAIGIRRRTIDGHVYLQNVRLKTASENVRTQNVSP
jgi:hypothetical protein